jgi:hypothetical protein
MSRGDAYAFLEVIARDYPEVLNQRNAAGENVLDLVIRAKDPGLIEDLLNLPGFRFSTRYVDKFINMCCYGNAGLFKKALDIGLEELRSLPYLLTYVQKRVDAHFRSILLTYVQGRVNAYDERARTQFSQNCTTLLGFIAKKAIDKPNKKLIDAIIEGNIDAVRKIFDTEGIDINYQDQNGRTPLMWAIAMGDFEMVVAILAIGPDLFVKDRIGQTALNIALKNRNEDIIAAVRQAEQAPNR